MKSRIHVSFNPDGHLLPELLARLRDIGIQPVLMYQNCSFHMDEADPRFDRVLDTLRALGIDPLLRGEIIYSKQELKAADLLALEVNIRARGSPQDYTAYDRSRGCPRCGTGAVQMGPLRIRSGDLPKRSLLGQSYTGEVFVADELATLIVDAVGSSVDLRQIEDARKGTPLPWWQILPQYRLPPLAAATLGVTRDKPCPVCNRDGYFHDFRTAFQPAYQRSDFHNLRAWPRAADAVPPDFALTYEHFGSGVLNPENDPDRCTVYAQPLIMVSNRVMRVFLDHKIRGAGFVPVRILD